MSLPRLPVLMKSIWIPLRTNTQQCATCASPMICVAASWSSRCITAEQFEAAWVDRTDLIVRHDDSYESVSATDDGREVYLVWRWDISDPERVFPITAYFLPDEG